MIKEIGSQVVLLEDLLYFECKCSKCNNVVTGSGWMGVEGVRRSAVSFEAIPSSTKLFCSRECMSSDFNSRLIYRPISMLHTHEIVVGIRNGDE
jgi:hypothetical protein